MAWINARLYCGLEGQGLAASFPRRTPKPHTEAIPQSPLDLQPGVYLGFLSGSHLLCVSPSRRSLPPFLYTAAMASNMPLPVPPRTPTPPPDDDPPHPVGLGFEGELSAANLGFNPNALSPMSATFPSRQYATLAPSDSISQKASPSIFTPASATFPYTPASAASGTNDTDAPSLSGSENVQNPFNFQPVTYQPGRPQVKQNVPSPSRSCVTLY